MAYDDNRKHAGECSHSQVCWETIPTEIKRDVIRNLPFQDKQNMMLVNWECFNICTTLPNRLQELCVTEIPATTKTTIVMKWKNSNGRLISRLVEYRNRQNPERQQDCPDHTKDALKAFLKIWKRSKIRSIVIEIPCFEGLKEIWDAEMLPKQSTSIVAKHYTIRTNDYRLVERAISAAQNTRLEISLLANDYGGMEKCIFDMDKVQEAKSVILWSLTSNISDVQLCKLSASNIRVRSENITNSGVVALIKEWQAGKRKIERLFISSPHLDLKYVVENIHCACWKDLSDICQVVWREVDEEGYTYATKGPKMIPAAMGLIRVEGVPTFILRIITMTPPLAKELAERCGSCNQAPVLNNRIENISIS